MKKIICVLLSLSLALSTLAVFTLTAGAENYGDFEYTVLEDGTLEITKYNGSDLVVTIPETLDEKTVSSIGQSAFLGSNIKGLSLSDSIVIIGYQAFKDCSSLETIDFGNNLMFILANAFSNCTSLSTVKIPNSLTYIGYQAFSGCKNLDVTYQGDYTQWMGVLQYAENDAINYGNFTYENAQPRKGLIVSLDQNGKIAVIGYNGEENNVVIPSEIAAITTKTVDDGAFGSLDAIESVSIPESVDYIGIGAFSMCLKLKEVTLPKGIEKLYQETFYWCKSLKTIEIPQKVKMIDDNCFNTCSNLESIIIPKSVVSISSGAFWGCESLKDVYYTGTEEEWNKILIGFMNDDLINANIHFNYVPTQSTKGDLNGDGTLDVIDVAMARAHIVGNSTLDETQIKVGDMNGDGVLDIIDVVMMRKAIVG